VEGRAITDSGGVGGVNGFQRRPLLLNHGAAGLCHTIQPSVSKREQATGPIARSSRVHIIRVKGVVRERTVQVWDVHAFLKNVGSC
jgi:hypothetical protein